MAKTRKDMASATTEEAIRMAYDGGGDRFGELATLLTSKASGDIAKARQDAARKELDAALIRRDSDFLHRLADAIANLGGPIQDERAFWALQAFDALPSKTFKEWSALLSAGPLWAVYREPKDGEPCKPFHFYDEESRTRALRRLAQELGINFNGKAGRPRKAK